MTKLRALALIAGALWLAACSMVYQGPGHYRSFRGEHCDLYAPSYTSGKCWHEHVEIYFTDHGTIVSTTNDWHSWLCPRDTSCTNPKDGELLG